MSAERSLYCHSERSEESFDVRIQDSALCCSSDTMQTSPALQFKNRWNDATVLLLSNYTAFLFNNQRIFFYN